eukprot:4978617-Lingulodinium_polyedra.AAC.1
MPGGVMPRHTSRSIGRQMSLPTRPGSAAPSALSVWLGCIGSSALTRPCSAPLALASCGSSSSPRTPWCRCPSRACPKTRPSSQQCPLCWCWLLTRAVGDFRPTTTWSTPPAMPGP